MGIAKDKKLTAAAELRRHAEKQLRAKKATVRPPRTEQAAQRLIHELEVHQIELEMQNAELKRSREELELSHTKYLDLYDFAPVGYFTIDARGLIEGINLTGAHLLGIERGLLLKRSFISCIAEAADREIFSKHRDQLFQKQGSQTCEIRLKRENGAAFWAQLKSIAKENSEGKAGNLHTSVVDITEHKKLELQLFGTNQRLQALLDALPVGVSFSDSYNCQRITGNPCVFSQFELRPEDNISASTPDNNAPIRQSRFFLEGRELRDTELPLQRAVAENRNIEPIELEVELPSGRRWFAMTSGTPIRDKEGNAISGIAVTVDITKHKQLEILLQKANDELEQQVQKRTAQLQTALSEIQAMKERLETENVYLRQEQKNRHQYDNIIGESAGLKYVMYRAEQVAPLNTTVLILGETGTGKELIAAAIHNMSPRKDRAMITVNCAALPGNLIESELFGREKGAYTGADMRRTGRFEIANGSTICLDEIGELPLELQAKLLRVIQHSEFERLGSSQTIKVDVRILATTNRNLKEEVRAGRFRQDLFYRLNVFPITVPPLRQRTEDIEPMVRTFIAQYAKKMGKQITTIPKETMAALQEYPWPGNVRELESIIERAIILCPGPALHLEGKLATASLEPASRERTLEAIERDHIISILSKTKWHIEGKDKAAAILGLHPSTLRARMHKLGIVRPGRK